jgi:hypothetical protein
LFELAVLVFELAQPSQFNNTHTAKSALPAVKGLLGDAGLTNQFLDRHSGFGLAQDMRDLLFSEAASLHPDPPF